MRAGRLRDSLQIQAPTEVADSESHDFTYSTIAVRRCDITRPRGTEFYRAAGESVELVYEIRFRYEPGLLREDRRLLDTRSSPNRIFDIESVVDPTNKGHELVVRAVERKWPKRN